MDQKEYSGVNPQAEPNQDGQPALADFSYSMVDPQLFDQNLNQVALPDQPFEDDFSIQMPSVIDNAPLNPAAAPQQFVDPALLEAPASNTPAASAVPWYEGMYDRRAHMRLESHQCPDPLCEWHRLHLPAYQAQEWDRANGFNSMDFLSQPLNLDASAEPVMADQAINAAPIEAAQEQVMEVADYIAGPVDEEEEEEEQVVSQYPSPPPISDTAQAAAAGLPAPNMCRECGVNAVRHAKGLYCDTCRARYLAMPGKRCTRCKVKPQPPNRTNCDTCLAYYKTYMAAKKAQNRRGGNAGGGGVASGRVTK
jgi:hypothetical protein